ncbi:hypothetical protein L1987_81187 [Smallanthus sonchifolius]|uniref:Uncharacterized protein n=1 Tax=Smallanthus sonchifolius TaxID=185202 RepID=A0ACB8YTZ7_9ASTR|nr:hypothetical protein L1987_81187 [Smallanthus sonchifolius]
MGVADGAYLDAKNAEADNEGADAPVGAKVGSAGVAMVLIRVQKMQKHLFQFMKAQLDVLPQPPVFASRPFAEEGLAMLTALVPMVAENLQPEHCADNYQYNSQLHTFKVFNSTT